MLKSRRSPYLVEKTSGLTLPRGNPSAAGQNRSPAVTNSLPQSGHSMPAVSYRLCFAFHYDDSITEFIVKGHMKRSVIILALLAATLATAWAQQPAAVPDESPEKMTTQQLDSYKAAVEAMPGIECRDIWAHQRQCSSAAPMSIWTFTLPGHPAHPATSRGVMTFQQTSHGNTVGINRSWHYVEDTAAFEAWVKDFHAVDEKALAQIRSLHNP
jgi:hypothetical protein